MIVQKYTKKEAAAYLKMSEPTLDRRRRDGLINSTCNGKKILFYEYDLDNYLKRNYVENYN